MTAREHFWGAAIAAVIALGGLLLGSDAMAGAFLGLAGLELGFGAFSRLRAGPRAARR